MSEPALPKVPVRQAILYGAGDLRIEPRPHGATHLEADQVFVETLVSALSTGTDLGNYLGKSQEVPGAPGYPRPVGYSNVGRVVAAGSSVRSLHAGQRVFSLKPHLSAFVARDSELLVPVPEAVGSEPASLAYLTQLGLAALRQAHYEPGENVTVIGLGVIGMCTVALARLLGGSVTAVANSPLRAEVAKLLGAHRVVAADEFAAAAAADADVIVLTANQWEAYRLAMEAARTGGRVAVLGFPGRGQPPPDFNPLDPRWLYAKQLSLIGAGMSPALDCGPYELRFNLRRNLAYILDRMADGSLDLGRVITHRLAAEDMKQAYELARIHDKSLIAAVFFWGETEPRTRS